MIKGTGYTHRKWYIYILMRYRMVRWFCLSVILSVWDFICLSVILSVRCRNHFPVVQFQNHAHIGNPHGTGKVFKTIWDAAGTSWKRRRRLLNFFFHSCRRRRKLTPQVWHPRCPKYGAPMGPQLLFTYSFTAAEGGGFPNGLRGRPNGGAKGAQRWRPRHHSPRGWGRSRRRRVFREYTILP